jgi:hypothetical protein
MLFITVTKLVTCKETEDSKTVMSYNDNHISLVNQSGTVVKLRASVCETATMNPKHDRFVLSAFWRSINIHKKTIFRTP